MSISSINYGASLLGLSVQNINNQLTNLSTELSSGVKSTNYAGMGVNEGFAIAARSQLANISAFTDTMTNVNTIISSANTALQSLSSTAGQVQSAAAASPQNLTSTGQTIGQQNAASDLSALVGILNTQVGNRYIFSGSAINTPAVASADDILNGTATQAGLKQVIAERQQADLGTTVLGRLAISSLTPPATSAVQVAEDAAGSPFGLKLNSVTSSLTNATVTGPSGSPPSVSVDMTAGNPNPGDQISFTFNLPDGTTESDPVDRDAARRRRRPEASPSARRRRRATATNLQTALNYVDRHAGQYLADGGLGGRSRRQFLQYRQHGHRHCRQQPAGTTPPDADHWRNRTVGHSTKRLAGQWVRQWRHHHRQWHDASPSATASRRRATPSTSTTASRRLLTKIDQITGTSTPSTIDGGAIAIHTDNASTLSIYGSSANATAAFASLGFTARADHGDTAAAAGQRLRRWARRPSLTNGSANTVAWYTGNSGPGSARSTSTVRIDGSQTVQFGAQANEQAIRHQLQQIAVYAAVTVSPTGTNSAA